MEEILLLCLVFQFEGICVNECVCDISKLKKTHTVEEPVYGQH